MNAHLCPICAKPLPNDAPQGICPSCLLQQAMGDSAAVAQPPELELQQLSAAFPQLVIEELIGQGGIGRVYRAQQPHLNRTVALKVLSAEKSGDPEWLERFNREARALARLSHPHIVQVYDFGEKPVPYLLMEHVEGVNLREAMQHGGLTACEALTIVPKLCDALHYAHEHGVLHRDIKPENILIDTEGRVKLVDFGLAKLRDEGLLPFTLTQSGAKLGTIAYMAPEQIEKPSEVDHRADIYSLGVVLYEMLTGELPLGRFPAPSEASGVDSRLNDIVMRTLEKQPAKRFQTAADMRTSLEAPALPEASPKSSRRPIGDVVLVGIPVFCYLLLLTIVVPLSAWDMMNGLIGLCVVVLGFLLSGFNCWYLRAKGRFYGVTSIVAAGLFLWQGFALWTAVGLKYGQPNFERAGFLSIMAIFNVISPLLKPAVLYLGWRWWRDRLPLRKAGSFLIGLLLLVIVTSPVPIWHLLKELGLMSP